MKKTYEKLNLDVFEEVLDNGLRVFLVPIKRETIHARMTALFGGSTLEFKLKGDKEFTKVPAGVAHFLEHKMFEKDGYDPLVIYENNGASANAFTSENITAYHFTGVSNFYDNLNTLLDLVHNPYFTDENVLKEKGIILQEKKEDLDHPYYIVYDKALENTFKNLDFKNTVLGSLNDIESITKEDLYACFNTFYHPSNMVLTISGNIDVSETLKFIKAFYKKYKFTKQKEIIIKEKKEPADVVKEKEVIYKDVNSSEIIVNYKIKKPKNSLNKYLNRIYFSMLLDMNFGPLTDILDITNKDKNYLSSISSRFQEVGDYLMVSFNVTVKGREDEVINFIDNRFKNTKFKEADFDLIKKSALNSLILSTESVYDICSLITNQIAFYKKPIYNMHELVSRLDFDTFKEVVSSLDLSHRCEVILKSK